jgi:hypothetical protein
MKWWGAEWHSKNSLDGESRHVMYERGMPVVFGTREEARHWIREKFGYIRHREDLRKEPHGWRLPKPVRIEITVRVCR